MKSLVLSIPENIDLEITETTRFLASKLYEAGKLSLGQASEMAGLSKSTFAEILKDFGVAYINYSTEDALDDASKI
ncbi:hypothetical protein MASR1M45_25330 [Candidatus Kapaibacterium sp.]